MWKRKRSLGPYIALLVHSLLSAPTQAENASGSYLLGPEDKLRITVFEWRAARSEVYEWSALKGEFTVNAAGKLSLPVVGEVQAAMLRTEELARTIAERLQSKVGLAQRPDATVEVIQFRPFYVLGDVNRPGEYAYRPGMAVLQAVSIAAGFFRPIDTAMLRFRREAIATGGDLRIIRAESKALAARAARLQAELDGAETITFPREAAIAQGELLTLQLRRDEESIFQSRREALRSQVESLEQVKTLLQREVESLRAKDLTQERQLGLAKRELDNVNSLLSKGLAISPRQLSLEQTVAQLEGARQDLNLSILRTRQDISKTDRTVLDLRNQRRNDTLLELRQTKARVHELSLRAATLGQLDIETQEAASQLTVVDIHDESSQPIFRVLRRGRGGLEEIVVGESAALEAGDILKVEWRGRARGGAVLGETLPLEVISPLNSTPTQAWKQTGSR